LQPIFGPGVHLASSTNEYQESSWGLRGYRRVRLTISSSSVSRMSGKYGSLDVSQCYGRLQPVTEITNSVELSTTRQAASCTATQDLPSILWNTNIRFRFHKSPPLVPILSQTNPVHTTPHSISPRSIFIISSHLRLGLTSDLFPSGFPSNDMSSSYPHSCYMSCSSHTPPIDNSNYSWRRVQVTKLLAMQISPMSSHFIPLRSKYSPQHPVLKHPSLCSYLSDRDQVSHPHRTTGKIIMLHILIFNFSRQ
jgi:hypothetical protein